MNDHKTKDQLAEICGCKRDSYRTMEARLSELGIPYLPRPKMHPLVSCKVYDAIISGQRIEADQAPRRRAEPNFAALGA